MVGRWLYRVSTKNKVIYPKIEEIIIDDDNQRPIGGSRYKQPSVRLVGEGVIGENAFSSELGNSHIWVGVTNKESAEDDWALNNKV